MRAAVILAAGKGTRMRSELPKVLHPLLGQPLLEYPVRLAESASVDRIVVVVGHGRDRVREAFAERDLVWAVQDEQLGTGHAARCGLDALLAAGEADPASLSLLVLNGDLPLLRPETARRLLERHEASGAAATVLTGVKTDPTGFGRVVRRDGRLRDIVEEPDADEATRALREVNVGTYVFRGADFIELYERTGRGNEQGEYYLPDVVVQAVRGSRVVETVEVADASEMAQVNSRLELVRASELLRERVIAEHLERGVSIDDPATTYIEPEVRIGRDTRIHPHTVIRRGVSIAEGCDVGPFAHLRAGVELAPGASVGNFVEVKNSRLGRGTKVRHLSYVGDGEVGDEVNIGAGTIFANYDGREKHRTVIEDGAFIGSGTILVAPVRVGRGAVTGAGAVVVRRRDVPDGETVVGVPARPLRPAREGDAR